jgi:TRAP transporter TAXI family solute receptor
MSYRLTLVISASLFLLGFTALATAQTPSDELREQINRGTVGIMSGGVNGTYIRVASDLADVLDSDELRVLTIVGKGSIRNIGDLLYLRGIDVAIVQSDVLEFMERQGTYPTIKKRINYITKLYNEEFHLLVRDNISSIEDLAGKKVSFDVDGSGTAMTASVVFDILGVAVEPVYHDQSEAVELLRSGEISGLVYVAGKPAQLFNNLSPQDQVKFLPIDFNETLLETYLPSTLDHDAYPNLVAEGDSVRTIAVSAVMAAYNWEPNFHRYDKVAKFVDRFFTSFDEFLKPARHPKWQEVSLSAEVPGWDRFSAAQTALNNVSQ